MSSAPQLDEQIQEQAQTCQNLRDEIGRVLVGQEHMVSRLLIGLLTGGHILLEGLPGLAKTWHPHQMPRHRPLLSSPQDHRPQSLQARLASRPARLL